MSDTEDSNIETDPAAVNNADSTRTDDDESDVEPGPLAHPWPYLREMFSFLGSKKDSHRFSCNLCKPKVKELLAYRNSPSNLKKHVEVNNGAMLT